MPTRNIFYCYTVDVVMAWRGRGRNIVYRNSIYNIVINIFTMSSWKQYGGIHKRDRMNHIHTQNLVADTFGTQTPYQGTFDISGGLYVENSVYVGESINAADTIYAGNDVVAGRNVNVMQNMNVAGSAIIYTDLTVVGNLTSQNSVTDNIFTNLVSDGILKIASDSFLNGNAYVYDHIYLRGNTGGNGIFQTGYGVGDGAFIVGGSQRIGINVDTPIAALDISGNSISSLNVYSGNIFSRNTIVQNSENRGIVVNTDSGSSSVEFYNGNTAITNAGITTMAATVGDGSGATIKYNSTTQNLEVYSGNNIAVANCMTVAVGTAASKPRVKGETMTVYDISGGIFQYQTYGNVTANTGTALSLVATDTSSNTFMHIVTPAAKGVSIGGGAYMGGDATRSMGTIGWFDSAGYYNPSQMLVSGTTGAAKMSSTMGFNTFAPRTDTYAVDINGPVHITNGMLKITGNTAFEVKALNASASARNISTLVAVGSPSSIGSAPFLQYLYYSSNSGQSWSSVRISPPNPPVSGNATDLELQQITFNSCYSYDANNAVIVGGNGYIFYTANGGSVWNQYAISAFSATLTSVFMDVSNIVFGSGVFLYYFARVAIPSTPAKITITTMQTVNLTSIANNTQAGAVTPNISVSAITGLAAGGVYYTAGGNTILKLVISSGVFSNNASYSGTPVYLSNYYSATTLGYNSIYAYDASTVIAVGRSGVITWTKNGGINWTNVVVGAVTFNSVYVFDTMRAVAVGNGAAMYITVDGFATWTNVPVDLINSAGNARILLNSANNFTSVTMPDADTFVVSSTIVSSGVSVIGNSIIFYCYLPNLFNAGGGYVLDVSGNMRLTGNVYAENIVTAAAANLQKYLCANAYEGTGFGNIYIGNSTTMSKQINIGDVSNTGVYNTINIGGLFDTINIGNSISLGGNSISILGNSPAYFNDTNVFGNLVVKQNINYVSGNARIYGVTTLGNSSATVDSTGVGTGALVVVGGVGVSSTLYCGGVGQFINGTAASSTTTGAVVVTGGVGISGAAFIGGALNVIGATTGISGNLTVGGNTTVGANLSVTGTTTNLGGILGSGSIVTANLVGSTSTTTGALRVGGGAGIFGNVNIGGNSNVNGNSSVGGNIYIGANLTVTGTTTNNGGVIGSGSIVTANLVGSTSTTTGALQVGGGAGIFGNVNIGGNCNVSGNSSVGGNLFVGANLAITGTTTNLGGIIGGGSILTANLVGSTSTTTGALQVGGGAGIFGNVNIGGNCNVNGNSSVGGNLYLGANLTIAGTTTNLGGIIGGGSIVTANLVGSTSTTTGALQVGGGVGVFGNVNIGGNCNINGNSSVGGNIFIGANLTITGTTTNSGGIIGGGSILTANLVGSTSTTTGALQVGGGAGIFGNVNIGGNCNVNGNSSVGGNIFIGANLTIAGTTTNLGGIIGSGSIVTANLVGSTSTTTGALRLLGTGGLGIGGNVFIGGNMVIANTTVSTSTTSGALIVTGGIGIGGAFFAAGTITGLSFNATSDYRIKSNIQQIENTIDILKPIKYFNVKTQKEDIGFLAHEVQEHYPFLVTGNKDEVDENGEPLYQSINYIGLIGILVKEIQNIKSDIVLLKETLCKNTV